MPVSDPLLQEALREAGLTGKKSNTSLNDKLAAEDLTTEDAIKLLADIAYTGDNHALRLRAVETVLKLQGLMKDSAPAAPVVNFIIQDSDGPRGLNPILVPRPPSDIALEPIELGV